MTTKWNHIYTYPQYMLVIFGILEEGLHVATNQHVSHSHHETATSHIQFSFPVLAAAKANANAIVCVDVMGHPCFCVSPRHWS